MKSQRIRLQSEGGYPTNFCYDKSNLQGQKDNGIWGGP